MARDCYVVFNQAFYWCPFASLAKQSTCGAVLPTCGSTRPTLVATHQRAITAGERLTHPDHLPPTHRPGLLLGREMALDRATVIGPATEQVVRTLLDDTVVDRLRTVGRILQLAERVGAVRLEAACVRALCYDAISHQAIKAILAQGLDHEPAPELPAPPAQTYVRDAHDTICWATCLAVWYGTNPSVEWPAQATAAVGHAGNLSRSDAPSGGWQVVV